VEIIGKDKWTSIMEFMTESFGKKPDMEAILFIIGMRELGDHAHREFSKSEKENLFHIAVCRLLSRSGYYELDGLDKDGWPLWKNTKEVPFLNIFEQETFLRHHIIAYFEEEEIIEL
jgi:hypothetical protein